MRFAYPISPSLLCADFLRSQSNVERRLTSLVPSATDPPIAQVELRALPRRRLADSRLRELQRRVRFAASWLGEWLCTGRIGKLTPVGTGPLPV